MYTALLSTALAFALTTSFTAPAPGGPPRAALCGKTGGEVQRSAVLASPQLELHGCVPGVKLTAFTFTCSQAKGQTVTLRTREARLSEQMVKIIGTLPVGSTFTLTDFDVVDGKGVAYELPDAVFKITA
jgi:hypothetical protein